MGFPRINIQGETAAFFKIRTELRSRIQGIGATKTMVIKRPFDRSGKN